MAITPEPHHTAPPAGEQLPECAAPGCPRCGAEMVRRTARRGPNQGQQFWGCLRFPKCRGVVSDPTPTAAEELAPIPATRPTSPRPAPEADTAEGSPRSGWRGKLLAAAAQVVETVDKVQRWNLELDEPDASGRWKPAHRPKVLRYVHSRDGRRCGLCAGPMKVEGAHIEHIVPKVFAVFDVHNGRAEPGTHFKSRLHKLNNLQAAHTYCNKSKGNTPQIRKWRHPDMPPLPVADTVDGQEFVLPYTRRDPHI